MHLFPRRPFLPALFAALVACAALASPLAASTPFDTVAGVKAIVCPVVARDVPSDGEPVVIRVGAAAVARPTCEVARVGAGAYDPLPGSMTLCLVGQVVMPSSDCAEHRYAHRLGYIYEHADFRGERIEFMGIADTVKRDDGRCYEDTAWGQAPFATHMQGRASSATGVAGCGLRLGGGSMEGPFVYCEPSCSYLGSMNDRAVDSSAFCIACPN